MGLVSAVRPVAPVTGHVAQGGAGSAGTGTASQNGSRTAPAASAETAQPVAQISGAARAAQPLTADGHLRESARAKVAAAQRAYMMTLRAAGVNPLINPAP